MADLLRKIESLRSNLYNTIEKCDGDLHHPRVIQASMSLDSEIAKFTGSECTTRQAPQRM